MIPLGCQVAPNYPVLQAKVKLHGWYVKYSHIIVIPIHTVFVQTHYMNNLPITITVMVVLLLPIGLVTVHVYAPLSLAVTLSME